MSGEAESALLERARALGAELSERVTGLDTAESVSREIVALAGEYRILASHSRLTAVALAIEELAAVWGSLAAVVSVSELPVAWAIHRHGTPEQRARWLPVLRSALGAFALNEASSGVDLSAIATKAHRDGSMYTLMGEKTLVTNASHAALFLTIARLEPDGDVGVYVVPADTPGLRIGDAQPRTALRSAGLRTVVLEGAVGEALGLAAGTSLATACLDAYRIGIAAQAVGAARGALDRATAAVKAHGKASFGAVGDALAQTRSEVDAARLLTLRAATALDDERPATVPAAMAKVYASEAAARATDVAIRLLGADGFLESFGVERLARDARATLLNGGANELQHTLIAASLRPS